MFSQMVLFLFISFGSIRMDCGFPALPESTIIDNYKKRYQEFDSIGYQCEDKSRQILIGDSTLVCFEGKWNGRLPKCARQLLSTVNQLYTKNTRTKQTLKVIPLNSISIKSDQCYGVANRDSRTDGIVFRLSNEEELWFYIQTETQFDYMSVVLSGQRLDKYSANKSLVVTAVVNKKRCQIDKIETFKGNDNKVLIGFDCVKPFSAYNHKRPPMTTISITWKTKNPMEMKFCAANVYSFGESCGSPEQPLHSDRLVSKRSFVVFTCEDDFYLKPKSSQKVVCGPFAQWKQPFPRCLSNASCSYPATDGNDPHIEVKYKDFNTFNRTLILEPKTSAIYSCVQRNGTQLKLVGDVKRVCQRGVWTGTQPKCVTSNESWPLSSVSSINQTNRKHSQKTSSADPVWFRWHLVVISMFFSLVLGASCIACIAFFVVKYMTRRRKRPQFRGLSPMTIPSLVISEPNHYYERNASYQYESLTLNDLDLLELQRINSLYQSNSQ